MTQKFEISRGNISFIININWDGNTEAPIFEEGDAIILLKEIK